MLARHQSDAGVGRQRSSLSSPSPPFPLPPPPRQMVCPAGTFSAGGVGRVTCSACPSGSYSAPKATACSTCPEGYSCPIPSAQPLPCPLGRYSLTGSPTCSLCPAGTYSEVPVAKLCSACPASAPYSPAGADAMARCTNCSSGCSDGSRGMFPCLDTSWVPWVNVDGVENSSSCVKVLGSSCNWSVANASCVALSAPGLPSHLLTSAQVGEREGRIACCM
jgi:hypothetical protein